MDKKWIKLTEDNVKDAIKKASISFSPKNNFEGLAKHKRDQWWWDLDILVGKTQGFNMIMTIDQDWDKKGKEWFLVTFHPWGCKPYKEVITLDKRPSDSKVVEFFNKYALEWLSLFVKKGLHKKYFYDDDGGQWAEWRLGRNKNISFCISRCIRGLGLEKRFGWKMLQNPLSDAETDAVRRMIR